MTEYEKARRWRESHGLSQEKLGELAGWSQSAIYWMERGLSAPRKLPDGSQGKPGPIDRFAWWRYKMTCAAVDAKLRGSPAFEWRPK